MGKPPVKLDTVGWIQQRGSARTHQIAQWLSVGAEQVDAMMAEHVASGTLVSCIIQRPGKPDEKEYRMAASGKPPVFMTAPVPSSRSATGFKEVPTPTATPRARDPGGRTALVKNVLKQKGRSSMREVADVLGETEVNSVGASLNHMRKLGEVVRIKAPGQTVLWELPTQANERTAPPADVASDEQAADPNLTMPWKEDGITRMEAIRRYMTSAVTATSANVAQVFGITVGNAGAFLAGLVTQGFLYRERPVEGEKGPVLFTLRFKVTPVQTPAKPALTEEQVDDAICLTLSKHPSATTDALATKLDVSPVTVAKHCSDLVTRRKLLRSILPGSRTVVWSLIRKPNTPPADVVSGDQAQVSQDLSNSAENAGRLTGLSDSSTAAPAAEVAPEADAAGGRVHIEEEVVFWLNDKGELMIEAEHEQTSLSPNDVRRLARFLGLFDFLAPSPPHQEHA